MSVKEIQKPNLQFDKYEAAILLDYCLLVKSGSLSRQNAIHRCSRELQSIAANKGLNVDESFRSEKGISFQMRCMENALASEGEPNKRSTRLFNEIVKLYLNHFEKYFDLLNTARGRKETFSMDRRENFLSWVEVNYPELESKKLKQNIFVIDALLKKSGIQYSHLWEIKDVEQANEIIDRIKKRRISKLQSNRLRGIAIEIVQVFIKYIYDSQANLEQKIVEDKGKKTSREGADKRSAEDSEKNKFYNWMISVEGLATPTARSYSSAISRCEELCERNNISPGIIHADLEGLKSITSTLTSNEEFKKLNYSQHNRLTGALAKYARYLSNISSNYNNAKPNEQLVSNDEKNRILSTLEHFFEYGFKTDVVEISRFRESYEQINRTECELTDKQLVHFISSIGFEFEGKVYVVSEQEKENIRQTLEKCKLDKVCIVYYESLFDSNFEEYYREKIVSSEMLKAIIQSLAPHCRFKNNYFTFENDGTEMELVGEDIVRVWGSSLLQTYDELSRKLPLIPMEKVKQSLASNGKFLWNSPETYVLTKEIHISDEDRSELTHYVEHQVELNGGVSLAELPFDKVRDQNPGLSEVALQNAFYALVKDRYDRNDKVLTKKGQKKDVYSAVIEYCRRKDHCTYHRLEEIARRVAGVVRQPAIVEAANAAMIRLDKDHFVADQYVKFDCESIDRALDQTVSSDFIGLREITTFSLFPDCGYKWNLYLLESYCRRFSKKYKYETRRANSSNSGAIVVKSCLMNYHDLMARAVARSNTPLDEENVFEFLTETGYMERKRYSDIDSLIVEATQIREGRN